MGFERVDNTHDQPPWCDANRSPSAAMVNSPQPVTLARAKFPFLEQAADSYRLQLIQVHNLPIGSLFSKGKAHARVRSVGDSGTAG
jgi:hypothetical protein